MNSFYITTPIYYVNDVPHIGTAYSTVIADVLARYHRIAGDRVLFVTGTDEHGQKAEQAAKERGVPTQQHCDEMVEGFKEAWSLLNISYDDFIRTTESRHTSVVTQVLQRIYDQGEIYAADYEGWYCVSDERFWTEKDLIEGNCPECGKAVSHISEKNYFFRMSAYQDWLIQHIHENPEFIQPESRRNEILGFLKSPLNDLCISRPKSRLSWGVPLPFDDEYVCYVWFDALINYLTAPGYLSDEDAFKGWWPADCHLIGKDIVTTHCVYWPTMLKALDLPLPKTVLAHGWWMTDERKMGKSLGNAVSPKDLAAHYGVDTLRYFLVREMTLGLDITFSEDSFLRRYHAELANDLGNLLNRSVVMVRRYLDGMVPKVDPQDPVLEDLRTLAGATLTTATEVLEANNLNGILDAVMELVRAGNRFAEQQGPWNQAKDPDQRGGLELTLYGLLETMRHLSVLLWPVMPERCSEIWRQLGCPGTPESADLRQLTWGDAKGLVAGSTVPGGDPVFPRIEKTLFDTRQEEAGVSEADDKAVEEKKPQSNRITFKDFQNVELKVARVVSAEPVEGADRLLRLQVSLGDEKRQLVAGIAKHYEPEALVGRQIVVVANLEPATIRGVQSEGMLLAASGPDGLALLQPGLEVPDGTRVS